MADVVLGPRGLAVFVDLDVCAKTGRTTDQRVTLRGSTWPGWVLLLLLITVVGFLLTYVMAPRRHSVTLPLVHQAYLRWKRGQLVAWVVGLCGGAALVAAATGAGASATSSGVVGTLLVVAALVGGSTASAVHGLRVRATRSGDLVLVGAHPDFVRAVGAAGVELVGP